MRGSLLVLALAVLIGGCQQSQWHAEKQATLDGFSTPESVRLDGSVAYVSNIVADETKEGSEMYWSNDGEGFIARLSTRPELEVQTLRWAQDQMDAPKGMAIHEGRIWVADNNELLSVDLQTRQVRKHNLPDPQKVNDVATDGRAVYVSDMDAGRIYKIRGNDVQILQAPKDVNGIAFHGDKMYAVSWSLHEVFRMDPSGKMPPKPLGVAEHFTNLDGIEVLEDGWIIVSDFNGHKVSVICPEGKVVRTLAELKTPADIALDRRNHLLYVPQFMHDKVVVYRLSRKVP